VGVPQLDRVRYVLRPVSKPLSLYLHVVLFMKHLQHLSWYHHFCVCIMYQQSEYGVLVVCGALYEPVAERSYIGRFSLFRYNLDLG
jgi:hypothetical protein